MSLPVNAQRGGVPYDPAAAASARAQREAQAQGAQFEVEHLRLKARAAASSLEDLSPNKRRARVLDQIEHAYRERARDRRS